MLRLILATRIQITARVWRKLNIAQIARNSPKKICTSFIHCFLMQKTGTARSPGFW